MPLSYLKEKLRRRKVRRTPTGDTYCYADSMEYLVRDHWLSVTQGQSALFLPTYLRCLELHGPKELSFRYALIYRDGSPIAGVVIQILDANLSVFLPPDSPLAAGSRLLDSRIFVCGSLLCWGNRGVAIRPGIAPETVWPSVAEALYRIRRSEKLTGETDFVIIRDLPADEPSHLKLKDYGYRPVNVEADMVLDLKDWTCFEDYLSSLQSKYRKAALSIRKKIDKAGCSLVELADPDQYQERLHQLYRAVWSEADVRPVEFASTYLPSLKSALGQDYALLALRQADQILGFVSVIRDSDRAIGYILGFDRDAAQELPIYLRLLQGVIERALQWGCRSVSFGGTALEPKARLGAEPSPRQVWARHRAAPLNVLIRPLLENFTPQQPPERNPFKKPS